MKMHKTLKTIKLVSIVALFATLSAGALAQGGTSAYDPGSTTVAILPVINAGAEKDPNFKAGQTKAAFEALHKQFLDRGFKVVDDKVIEDAIAAAKVDLNDEEQQSKQTILNIGTAAKADLVAFVVINKVNWNSQINLFATTKQGHAKMTMWLLDVKTQTPILSAKPQEGKHSEPEVFRNSVKPSELIIKACADGVKQSLAKILKPYPITAQKN
jgi:hypothetical protein